MDLHRRIRTLRLRRGMTGMELARRAGVSPSYVSLIEHGEKIPSEDVAVRIAQSLGEREDLYRVWAATSRMDEKTRQAVLRLRGGEGGGQRLDRGEEAESGAVETAVEEPPEGATIEGRRPPGRPRIPGRFEFQVAYRLEDETLAPTLRIPLLAPGAMEITDPPQEEQVEALVAIDSRIVDRPDAAGLVALRLDENSSRLVQSWFKPQDLVIIDRHPREFQPGLLHAFQLEDGLRLARATLTPNALVLLPDPLSTEPPRSIPVENADSLGSWFFGSVLWSGRLWTGE